MSPQACQYCDGRGEVVARSRPVGNGAVNDDWDTCPKCHGHGKAPTQAERVADALSVEDSVALKLVAATALRDAVWKSLERPGTPVLWERRLRDARRALQVLGLTSEEIEREERVARDAFAEYERERAAVWSRDPKSVTTHELEALR